MRAQLRLRELILSGEFGHGEQCWAPARILTEPFIQCTITSTMPVAPAVRLREMASAGADWQTSASTQIAWGLAYIKDTYGSPSQVPGWTTTGPAAGYVGY